MSFCASDSRAEYSTLQSGSGGANPTLALSNLRWVECQSTSETKIFRETIDNYHSYMKCLATCNRRINFNVYLGETPIAALGINSAILALSCRDNWIGWSAELRRKYLNCVANNYRFAVREKGIPNLGTRLLKGLRITAPAAWKRKYGDDLLLLETLVKPPWTGKVYRADNWTHVGMTKGFSFSKAPLKLWQQENSARGQLARDNPKAAIEKYACGGKHYAISKSEPKLVFVYPLVQNLKERLV